MKPQSLVHALSPLHAALLLAGVAALPDTAVEQHKAREAAKYPATLLWKAFDSKGIPSLLVLIGIPIAVVIIAGFATVLTSVSAFVHAIFPSWYGVTLNGLVSTIAISGGATFAAIVWLGLLVTGTYEARPPARWIELDLGLARVPAFARARAEALVNTGLIIPAFIVAELRQGQDLLDPILYAEFRGERIAIAVWDDAGNEIILDE